MCEGTDVLDADDRVGVREDLGNKVDERRALVGVEAIGALISGLTRDDVCKFLLDSHEVAKRSLWMRGSLRDRSTASGIGQLTDVGILDAVIEVR